MTTEDRPPVLDASAVLVWMRAEVGAAVVAGYLATAAISAVNLSEVHQKLAQYGVDADRMTDRLRVLGVRVAAFDADDAVAAARLWPSTRSAGLSLGDRCCLALASRLDGFAVTADRAWTGLDLDVPVVSIRDDEQ
ncbi:type II toxin-antitoxin system VapC family toxin [Actinomycetospora sp. OC33-EN08]|uniref:Type II toxin-antitoxin system VapC family toxin n=1 Tax=Actinomycetospora aurantiaca TaxID=3129233 RepID=A0ABU8MWH2_9PSEU